MNKTITSREAILSAGKEIITESGIQGLNMRDVARKCGVSVGSVYNYFPSKSHLAVATIESVWMEILYDSEGFASQNSFEESVLALFRSMREGSRKYPSFFSAHAIGAAGVEKEMGRETMNRYFSHIRGGLLEALHRDPGVKKGTFSETFSDSDFVSFVFDNMILLRMNGAESCRLLMEMICRIIYADPQ